jgi:WD40 repeat protein
MTTNPPPDTIYSFKGSQTEIHCLNFLLNSSEEKILSGTRNGEVFIWDLESLNLCHSFQTGDGSCISILLPDDQHLLTHSRGDTIRKWARKSDGTFKETGHLSSSSLQYCSAQLVEANETNEKLFIFPNGDAKAVSVAEVQGMKVVGNLSYPDNVGSIMGLTAAGKGLVLAVFEAGDLVLWDVRTSAPLQTHKMVCYLQKKSS